MCYDMGVDGNPPIHGMKEVHMKSLFPSKHNLDRVMEVYGDLIWEELCDVLPTGAPFKPSDLQLQCVRHLTPSIQNRYIRFTLQNIILEYADHPGNCPVTRLGHAFVL